MTLKDRTELVTEIDRDVRIIEIGARVLVVLAIIAAIACLLYSGNVRAAGVEPACSPASGVPSVLGPTMLASCPAIAPAHAPASYARTAEYTADAPVPKPSPKPSPRATPRPVPVIVEPFDAPVDVPGELQPDTVPEPPPVAPLPPLRKTAAFDLTKWAVTLDAGLVSVVLNNGEKREYATGAVAFDGPLYGLDIWTRAELMGVQDGGRLQFTRPQSFRAVQVDAAIAKPVGAFAFAVRGGTTLSVEGGQFAPVDPRLWILQGEVAAKLKRVILRGRGGHDGRIGGYGLGADIEVPVAGGRPQLITSFDYPLTKKNPSGPLPWQLTAGARIVIVKSILSDLF